MANLVGPETIDTASTDGNCTYPAKALGGSPFESTVVSGGVSIKIYDNTSVPDSVEGIKINPAIPVPCQPGQRIILPKVNQTVFFNGRLPAVTGDEAQLVLGSTPRPLTGPYQHPTIVIGSRVIE